MAGLLKQLQKDKSAHRSEHETAVICTRPADVSLASTPTEKQISTDQSLVADTRQLLAEAPAEADSQSGSLRNQDSCLTKSAKHRVVRRSPTKRQKRSKLVAEDTPSWLNVEPQDNPQVEVLMSATREILKDALSDQGEEDVYGQIQKAVGAAARTLREEIRLTRKSIEQTKRELLELLSGKGPLRPLYEDPGVTDIFIDNHKSIKVIRHGHAMEAPFSFRSEEEYRLFLDAMLRSVNRKLDSASPIVDCVLDDTWRSRMNVVDSSLLEGREPRVCIRVPRLQKIVFYDILHTKTLPPTLAAWLAEVVALGEANILVLGPAGSGKTVMTAALLSAVGSDERIITIEDVPELFVPTIHLEKLVSRPANAQGEEAVTMADLLRASLRRAPHRIVVGEIREEESSLFLRALETGHAGSIATIQAESSVDALWRLLDLIASFERSPQESIMRRIGRSVHLLVTMKKIDGSPCLTEVVEVKHTSTTEFEVLPLVSYLGTEDGKRKWQLEAETSYWMDRVAAKGMQLAPGPSFSAKSQEETIVKEELSPKKSEVS